jgi:hypothetical protein
VQQRRKNFGPALMQHGRMRVRRIARAIRSAHQMLASIPASILSQRRIESLIYASWAEGITVNCVAPGNPSRQAP